jgi:hypothetical protein
MRTRCLRVFFRGLVLVLVCGADSTANDAACSSDDPKGKLRSSRKAREPGLTDRQVPALTQGMKGMEEEALLLNVTKRNPAGEGPFRCRTGLHEFASLSTPASGRSQTVLLQFDSPPR